MNKAHDERFQLYVLQIVKYDIDISQVVGESFTYQDIIEISNVLKLNGKLSSLSGELCLTEKGEVLYMRLMKELKVNSKGPLIMPQYQYLCSQLDKFDIYLKDKDIPR